jgi:prepilin-type N-terminal cleavage/methylation domain-containing protein
MTNYSVTHSSFTRQGFTIIELLVVISIVSVLATIIMFSFVGVRQSGRDSQRRSDIRQIQIALELYRADTGVYPDALSNGPHPNGKLVAECKGLFGTSLSPYLKSVPCDPSGTGVFNGGFYGYIPAVSGGVNTTYTLNACLENANDTGPNNLKFAAGTYGCASGNFYQLKNE